MDRSKIEKLVESAPAIDTKDISLLQNGLSYLLDIKEGRVEPHDGTVGFYSERLETLRLNQRMFLYLHLRSQQDANLHRIARFFWREYIQLKH